MYKRTRFFWIIQKNNNMSPCPEGRSRPESGFATGPNPIIGFMVTAEQN